MIYKNRAHENISSKNSMRNYHEIFCLNDFKTKFVSRDQWLLAILHQKYFSSHSKDREYYVYFNVDVKIQL